MHVTVFENSLGDSTRAFGDTIQRHNLSLHIGGKSGVLRGAEIDGLGTTRHLNTNPILTIRHDSARLAQFINHRIQQIGTRMPEHYITTGRSDRTQKRTGFNAICNHCV